MNDIPSPDSEIAAAPAPKVVIPPPLPVEALPVKAWRWWVHLLVLLPYPILLGLVGVAGRGSRPGRAALSGDWKGLLYVCGVEMAVFSVILGLALWFSKATLDDLWLRLRRPGMTLLMGMGYSVAMRMAVGIVVLLLVAVLVVTGVIPQDKVQSMVTSNRPDIEAVVDGQSLTNDPVYFILMVTVVSFVVAGLREELWRAGSLVAMRKAAPSIFGSPFGQFAAVIITSLIFGFGHLPQGLGALGLTTLLGIGLGSIMVFHRSIWIAVIAHGFFDATSFVLIPTAVKLLKELKNL